MHRDWDSIDLMPMPGYGVVDMRSRSGVWRGLSQRCNVMMDTAYQTYEAYFVYV